MLRIKSLPEIYSAMIDFEYISAYGMLKWSGKIGQCAKMYPTRLNGYENDKTSELFRPV